MFNSLKRKALLPIILITLVPLILTFVVPLEMAYIPVIGSIYIILVQMYLWPLFIFQGLGIQMFVIPDDSVGLIDWTASGVFIAILFWLIVTSIISIVVIKRDAYYAAASPTEKRRLHERSKKVLNYYKYAIIILAITAIVGTYIFVQISIN